MLSFVAVFSMYTLKLTLAERQGQKSGETRTEERADPAERSGSSTPAGPTESSNLYAHRTLSQSEASGKILDNKSKQLQGWFIPSHRNL